MSRGRPWGLSVWTLAALLFPTLLLTQSAHGEPSAWAKARQPGLTAQAAAKARVEELLAQDLRARARDATAERLQILREARRKLENVGATTSSDTQLRKLSADVFYSLYQVQGRTSDLERATRLLTELSQLPMPSLQRVEVLMDLALCNARLGRHDAEVSAYDRALRHAATTEQYSLLLANQAEGLMALGRIREAVRGYRDSLAATPSIATLRYGVTTHWGLAAALDRSGDLSAALDHIRVARTYDPGDLRINGADWLFVPLHDEHWYHALGHWQRARAASTSEERLAAYREAIHAYTRYIEHAANNDRWVVLAEQRQRQCEHELRGAMKRPR